MDRGSSVHRNGNDVLKWLPKDVLMIVGRYLFDDNYHRLKVQYHDIWLNQRYRRHGVRRHGVRSEPVYWDDSGKMYWDDDSQCFCGRDDVSANWRDLRHAAKEFKHHISNFYRYPWSFNYQWGDWVFDASKVTGILPDNY